MGSVLGAGLGFGADAIEDFFDGDGGDGGDWGDGGDGGDWGNGGDFDDGGDFGGGDW